MTDPDSTSESDDIEAPQICGINTPQTEENFKLDFDNVSDWSTQNATQHSDSDDNFIDNDEGSNYSLSDYEKLISDDDEDELCDEESENDESKKKENAFGNEIRNWGITFKITLAALTALLLILKLFTNYVLPLDARKLLSTQRRTKTEEMYGGECHHFGLKRAIKSMIREIGGQNVTFMEST